MSDNIPNYMISRFAQLLVRLQSEMPLTDEVNLPRRHEKEKQNVFQRV
jgi:hypothetical protein